MCLTSYSLEPTKAKKDIEVYKVLCEDNMAPFQHYYTYVKGLNEPTEIKKYKGSTYYGATDIHGGYLHAYLEEICAVILYNDLKKHERIMGGKKRFKIVKMIIPKGAEIWVGKYDDICSNKLYWENTGEKIKRLINKIFGRA